MELDVNSLGELLRKERSSSSLQSVDKTFYDDLGHLLKEVDETYPPYSRERENLKNLVTDLFNTREKKLVLFALSYARSGEDIDTENLTLEEGEFLRGLTENLRDRRGTLKSGGKETKKKLKKERKKQEPVAEEKTVEKKGGTEVITLRMLQDLPPVVGSDGKTYGEFKAEDVVALPESNARLFIKHGYGEQIEHEN